MPSTTLALVLVDELIRCGVTDAVLCPGSRSAPLAYALAAADRGGRLRLHVRVDERVGAFVALGLAKGSGRVVPVVTTSGTAVANLHPAVLEADAAGVPLLALTADRPPELRGTGANQTADQVKLFGTAVRWWHELAAPSAVSGEDASIAPQAAAWRTAADRAVAAALGVGGRPGPVHLDVPLREPLVTSPEQRRRCPTGRTGGTPWTMVNPPVGRNEPAQSSSDDCLTGEPRTLVLLGDLGGGRLGAGLTASYERVLGWAACAGFPVVAEPFGPRPAGGPVLPHGRLLAAIPDGLPELAPRRIVVAGRLTLSRPVAALLRRPDTEIVVTSSDGRWADPSHVAHRVIDLTDLTPRSTSAGRALTTWLAAWRRAADAVHTAVAPALTGAFPHGPALAATVLGALPVGSRLFVGSSAVPRDVEVARTCDGADVWASRGLAGIDGCLSTAIGLALAAPTVPTYALMGDLSFLHDANALMIGPDEPVPDLTVVVLNDDGGAIFGTLEYGEPSRVRDPVAASTMRRVFTTPTGADLSARCAAHGVGHVRVRSAAQLAEVVRRRPQGLLIAEVDARGSDRRAHEASLAERAATALRGVGSR